MAQSLLLLVDGSSYLFRAYHALPALTNSKGIPTGAIYGVVNMLKRLLKDYQPDYVGVVFDPKGKTFRHDLYPLYKANRRQTPPDLATQIPPLYDMITAMGLPLIVVEEVEADDVIATLATIAAKQAMKVIIATGDKDLAQLVNDHISLVNTMTGMTLDSLGVEQKFNVLPCQIVDYLTLIGDSSDNIPGVPKVGPKTAAKWLHQYGNLAKLINNASHISGKIGKHLQAAIPSFSLIKRLITLKRDVKLTQKPTQLKPTPPHHQRLIALFKDMEFKNWLKEQLNYQDNITLNSCQSHIITTNKDFNAYLTKLKNTPLWAFDIETTSLDHIEADIVGLSFAIPDNDSTTSHAHIKSSDAKLSCQHEETLSLQSVYIPLAHHYQGVSTQLDRQQILAQLKPVLESPTIKKVGQNLKYDKAVLANYGIDLNGVAFDTMLESYIFNSVASRHDLDSLALKYLGHRCISYESLCGKGAKQIPFSAVPIEKAACYAAEDASVAFRLHHYFWPLLQQDEPLQRVFSTIEMPLLSILVAMERKGVLIDSNLLQQQSKALACRLEELAKQAYQLAKQRFNINSPKQLQAILFQQLNLPVIKKTPKGQPSTAEEVLQDLAYQFSLPKLILEYRQLSKLKSTYTDRLPQQINKKTNRIHSCYHQAVTSTGRLSSSDPNLQNIPTKTTIGRRIRQAFIAPPGYKIIAADYSQIELRLMAHLSGDQQLQQAFANNQDIHAITAAQVFNATLDSVTYDQRRRAKAINFGLIYGMSAFGLAKQLGVSRIVAQNYIDAYFLQYPGVKIYMDNTRKLARQQGFVQTLFGRKLYINNINASNTVRRLAAERIAINAPLQGSAADIIKIAMIAIDHWINRQSIAIEMIMQVHDELVFEVANDQLPTIANTIKQLMEQAATLKVPLVVEVGVGDNWQQAH